MFFIICVLLNYLNLITKLVNKLTHSTDIRLTVKFNISIMKNEVTIVYAI